MHKAPLAPRTPLLALLVVLLVPGLVSAQGMEEVRSRYTKYEFRIPMRDGVRLFTSVYVPKETSRTYPIMMMRTPYSVAPYGIDKYKGDLGPSPAFGSEGFIFAYQDVRGRWMSEGEFVHMQPHRASKNGPSEIDESSDTYDTIDWLLKNVPGHNGKVGQWGISYPGFYTSAGLIDAHPALVASSPQAPVSDWFIGDDWHHNGAFQLPHAFNFLAVFGRPRPAPTSKFQYNFDHGTPDGYQFFLDLGPLANADAKHLKGQVAYWNELMSHGSYDDYWKARNIRPHLKGIKPAVLTVGGWFDAENLFGAIQTYRAIETSTPGARNSLVMGPWIHGGWSRADGDSLGDVRFASKTSAFYRESIELPFFKHHLKGGPDPDLPEAFVFETGRNQWRKYDTWPPRAAKATPFHLGPKGQLLSQAPQGEGSDADPGYDEYVSDPAKPVPFQDKIAVGMSVEYMVGDQRFAGRRPDVLAYQTPPLERDLAVVGPIEAELTVSTTGTDSDWIVKVIDVHPDDAPDPDPNPKGVRMGGYQQMVRGDIFRGKFRNSPERPEPFKPGEPTSIKFTLQDVHHTFRTGHRLMVQVQSSWFPLFDRNPQTFCDIYAAKESDFVKATQRVYRTGRTNSRLVLNVLP